MTNTFDSRDQVEKKRVTGCPNSALGIITAKKRKYNNKKYTKKRAHDRDIECH